MRYSNRLASGQDELDPRPRDRWGRFIPDGQSYLEGDKDGVRDILDEESDDDDAEDEDEDDERDDDSDEVDDDDLDEVDDE